MFDGSLRRFRPSERRVRIGFIGRGGNQLGYLVFLWLHVALTFISGFGLSFRNWSFSPGFLCLSFGMFLFLFVTVAVDQQLDPLVWFLKS